MTENTQTPNTETTTTEAPVEKTLQDQLNAPLTPPAKEAVNDPQKTEEQPKTDPATDPKPTEEKPTTDDPEGEPEVLSEYITYGDESADAAVTLMKNSGLTPEEAHAALLPAIQSGDFSKVDMAKLSEKMGKEGAMAALALVKSYYDRSVASVKAVTDSVYAAVGGKENFDRVVKWTREAVKNNPELAEQVGAYNKMFELGKTPALMAAGELTKLYNADPKNRSLTVRMVNGTGAASVQANLDPLTRNDYLEQVKVAYDKKDYKQVQELRARREATRRTE